MALNFRAAARGDVATLVRMLADDNLGKAREDATGTPSDAYFAAFDEIAADGNNEIIVAEDRDGIAGFLQLTFIPYLTYRGSWRAQIEGVRVRADLRGQGLGRALIERAIDKARKRGCHLLQLTSDKRRDDARRFYERLGFKATHEGFKLQLGRDQPA